MVGREGRAVENGQGKGQVIEEKWGKNGQKQIRRHDRPKVSEVRHIQHYIITCPMSTNIVFIHWLPLLMEE